MFLQLFKPQRLVSHITYELVCQNNLVSLSNKNCLYSPLPSKEQTLSTLLYHKLVRTLFDMNMQLGDTIVENTCSYKTFLGSFGGMSSLEKSSKLYLGIL